MIKIGNLILGTMALVDLTNSRYFKIYELLFRKLNMWNFEHNGISNYQSSYLLICFSQNMYFPSFF